MQQFCISPSMQEELTRAIIHFSLVFILDMKKKKSCNIEITIPLASDYSRITFNSIFYLFNKSVSLKHL